MFGLSSSSAKHLTIICKLKISKGQRKIFLPISKKMKQNGGKMNIFKVCHSNLVAKFGLTSRDCVFFAGEAKAS